MFIVANCIFKQIYFLF